MSQTENRKERVALIIRGYPVALILISVVLNLAVFGVAPAAIGLPSPDLVAALVITCLLLVLNHTWLMTSTELTRLEFNMHATPEEWDASDNAKKDVPPKGLEELERRHNAHRNATENTTLFVLLALAFSIVSPTALAAQVWLIGFGLGRLGHTYSFLSGRSGLRGLFMSISLLSLYGMSSYLAICLLV